MAMGYWIVRVDVTDMDGHKPYVGAIQPIRSQENMNPAADGGIVVKYAMAIVPRLKLTEYR